MIDSHCHLDFDVFDSDRDDVIEQAQKAGVTQCHIPGTQAAGWSNLIELANSPFVDISLGLHPYFLNHYDSAELNNHLAQLRQHLQTSGAKIFAVGECGLDAVLKVDPERQRYIFKQHVDLASYFAKPLIVHARKTHHHIIQCLNECNYQGRGIIHAFSGSLETATAYIDRGWKLGIGGTITYPRGIKTRKTIQQIGIEHLVLETDAPDMPLFGFQGQRNEPSRVALVAEAVADILNLTVEQVAEATSKNYLTLAQ